MTSQGLAPTALRVLLIDDHELFRAGIKLLLQQLSEDIQFAEAASCAAALALPGGQSFDVVLLDMHMPGVSGMAALPLVRNAFERAAIVVLSGEDDPALIRRVIDAGAAGFIPKNSSQRVMMAALQLVLAGGIYLPPDVMGSSPALLHPAAGSSSPLALLSERQLQALKQAMQGKPNKIIAREMDISEATVKAHLAAAFRVLGVKNRTEAVFAAARAGLGF